MNDIQGKISELRDKGWTIQAIADELGIHRSSVRDWIAERYYPDHSKLVNAALEALMQQTPPKKRRYPRGHYLQRRKAEQEKQ